jgi:hypothetical protein
MHRVLEKWRRSVTEARVVQPRLHERERLGSRSEPEHLENSQIALGCAFDPPRALLNRTDAA